MLSHAYGVANVDDVARMMSQELLVCMHERMYNVMQF